MRREGKKTIVDRSRKSSVLRVGVWRSGFGQCSPVWVSQACGSPPLPASAAVTAYQRWFNVSLYRPWLHSPTHQGKRRQEGTGRKDANNAEQRKDSVQLNRGDSRESEVADKSVGNEAPPIILKSTRQRRLYGCGRSSVARWLQLPYTCGERTLALSVAWGKPAFNEDMWWEQANVDSPPSARIPWSFSLG